MMATLENGRTACMHSAAAPDETTTHCIDQVQGKGEHRFRRVSRPPPSDIVHRDEDTTDSAADGDCDSAPVSSDLSSAVGR